MQRIFSEAVEQTLQKGLSPFYLLVGQDLLLIGESKDSIVKIARKQGFDEKNEFTISNETKWDSLYEQAQSYGLFANRQIIILNFPETITAFQKKQLTELLSLTHSDLLFILNFPKLTKVMEQQTWFSQIADNSTLIHCQTPDITKLPQWLKQRIKTMKLQLENEAISLLCYSYEGNLLALKQVLQLLQLQFPQQKISVAKVQEVIERSAQFTPFQWIDSLLEGKIGRATRVLNSLKNENVQPVVLLRLIQKELMILLEITRSPQPISIHQPLFNGNLRSEFDRLKIWQNRRMYYQNAVNRFSYRKLYTLIQCLVELEKQIKQEFSDEIWLELERFCLQFS
ncbi:DNA polymerase III subunit delta [Vespertiliibacter pulmonis]|uniref:DNA polymerase III subunit delta n=1 Tax=Vespertiliibacter pulmonis TaxID=1443036 RepID=UPI000F524D82|nr:DNA polymerase III subunit delta [Vespertiliibacter pulmonis]QLB21615.1 DNA polymerase III subunit delta [Vespertiliibacter pulmonis]